MSLVEDFKIAKKEKRAIFLKKYFPTEINWERILWFLYNQSLIDNIKLIEKDRDLASGVDVFGNVLYKGHYGWLLKLEWFGMKIIFQK